MAGRFTFYTDKEDRMADNESDILEVVDEFVDFLDVSRVESEAERLSIQPGDLLDRIVVEARARLAID